MTLGAYNHHTIHRDAYGSAPMVLVSQELSLVYVHIYKTAGSSLTRVLAQYSTSALRSPTPRDSDPGWQGSWHYRGGQHAPLEPVLTSLMRSGDVDTSFRLLSVVRNPYTWYHSIWRSFYVETDSAMSADFAAKWPQRTFEQFTEYLYQLDGFARMRCWGGLPQSAFLRTEYPLELMLARFESLGSDLPPILKALGISVSELPHENRVGLARVAGEDYTDKAVELVNRLSEEDFIRFDYPMYCNARELRSALKHGTS